MAGQFVSCAFVVCFAKYSTTRNLQAAAELGVMFKASIEDDFSESMLAAVMGVFSFAVDN